MSPSPSEPRPKLSRLAALSVLIVEGCGPAPPAGTSALQQAIDAELARLPQVSCVLHCLYEVLLCAEGDEAVTYAETAHLAANLIDESVERLDPIRLGPMIEAITSAGEKERSELGGPYEIREPRVAYVN